MSSSKRFSFAIVGAIALTATGSIFSGVATAANIGVSSYNITNASPAGFGGWNHFYNGTITNNSGTSNYSGGSGTLNDGLIGTNEQNTQLFSTPAASTITIFLNQIAKVENIKLFSFDASGRNTIPGNISSLNVTINGITQNFGTTGFGPVAFNGPVHELIDFTSSAFANLATDRITFSNFLTVGRFPQAYSISEITVDGNPATAVPTPALLPGLIGLGFSMLRKRKAEAAKQTSEV